MGNASARVAVVGIGNDLSGDDAVGALVARELSARVGRRAGCLVLDAGTAPENFTGPLRRFRPDFMLLVDAAQLSAEPGSVAWLRLAADGSPERVHPHAPRLGPGAVQRLVCNPFDTTGMMMHRTALRSALLVPVLLALVAIGGTRAYAQAPTQAPATAAAPTPPPAPADVAAVPADAEKSASGLAWKVLKPGTGGAHPTATDWVWINYNGWTTNGRVFDSTDMRGKPSHYLVGTVLPGMAEGIKLLTVGEKRRFWMPEKLAFNSAPGKPQGMCVFEIELLDIQAATPALSQAPPPDVTAPPADAITTKSGLASKVITAGTGKDHPKATSTVTVKYVGWTPDGKMFDASALHGGDATFPLNGVIPGWTEGVQLMVEGEHRRFWIPGNLAYDNINAPGAPKGMLVFDVVLVKIQ